MSLPIAHAVVALAGAAAGVVRLPHHARVLRRRRLTTVAGEELLVDLRDMASLGPGSALLLEDGRLIAVEAEPEMLLEARGDLVRLAWHVGNRHAPCEIGPGWLRVVFDRPMEVMLRGLGAEVSTVTAPFHPEGGAYGDATVQGHGHDGCHEHHGHGGHAHEPHDH